PERPVSVLERCTGLLRHGAHGCRPLGTVLDVAQALLGEAAQHDVSRHVMSSRIVAGVLLAGAILSARPAPRANNTAFFTALRQAGPTAFASALCLSGRLSRARAA